LTEAKGLGRLTNVQANVVCYDDTTSFTGKCTELPGNVAVSKHMSAHALSEIGKRRKTLVYHL